MNVPQVDEHTNEFLDHDDNDLLEVRNAQRGSYF